MEQKGLTPPFLASARWYAEWWRARMEGKDDDRAITDANIRMEKGDKKHARNFTRSKICMADGREQLLSVPLQGGARAWKTGKEGGDNLISDHGNWRHVHLGAINAAYGKTPFFPYLFPEIEEAYRHSFGSIGELNIAIHRALSSFILNGSEISRLRGFSGSHIEASLDRGREIGEKTDPERSILDFLMKFGPETLLYLYHTITKD